MAKRARVRQSGRKSAGQKRRAPKSARPVGSARPASSSKYAGLSVYDPVTRRVVGNAGGQAGDALRNGNETDHLAGDLSAAVSTPAFPSRGFFLQVGNGTDRYREHCQMGCPYCVAPQFCEDKGWPAPAACPVWVTPNVQCRDTASAGEGRHHWDCLYWEHVENATPF